MARNKDPSMSQRNYNWCVIAYLESIPLDWQKRLNSLHIKAVVSPLHSPDPDPDYGIEKKKHYHVMFMYDSLKSRRQAFDDFVSVFGDGFTQSHIEAPASVSGMLRYFCHINEPGKEKLNVSDVITFGGVEYLDAITEEKNIYFTLMDITNWIHEHHCKSFVGFILYCQYNNLEWARIASTRATLFVKSLIESERNYYKDILPDEYEKGTATTTAVQSIINNQE